MFWFLIDQIIECDPGQSIHAVKCFTRAESFFQHHFNNFPIVPGVLQIEMMATAGGKAIKLADENLFPVLGSVKKAKFSHPIHPGDQCQIFVDIDQLRQTYALAHGRVEVNNKTVSQCEVLYGLMEPDLLDSNYQDPILRDWQRRSSQKTNADLK